MGKNLVVKALLTFLMMLTVGPVMAQDSTVEEVYSIVENLESWGKLPEKQRTKKSDINQALQTTQDALAIKKLIGQSLAKTFLNQRGCSDQSFIMGLHRILLLQNPKMRPFDMRQVKENINLLEEKKMNRKQVIVKILSHPEWQDRMADFVEDMQAQKIAATFATN